MQAWWTAQGEWLRRGIGPLQRHPKRVTAAIAALMLCAGGGAFAVASIGPDPADLPVRMVLEAVEPLPLEPQSEALDTHVFHVHTSDTVRPADTAEGLLRRLGINDPDAAAFLRRDAEARRLVLGAARRTVTAEATAGGTLQRLVVRHASNVPGHFRRVVVERQPDGRLATRSEIAPYTAQLRIGSGVIRTSLFAAVDAAGIPDEVAIQLVDIFGGAIDFHRSLRLGDRFHVIYETLEADGEPVRTGRVISADFVNNGRRHSALWYQPAGGTGGYFDFDGRSLERQYLASPMQVSRVTSGFKMRFHPILKSWRQHKGVDYGAPAGTPVRTVGDGKVTFAGWLNGYGKVVQVDHGGGDATLYAHLSRIDVRVGQQVTRGQHIGAVGSTGWATGPHLHFEFRQGGMLRDPLEVARRMQPKELPATARADFQRVASALRSQIEAVAGAADAVVASAQ